MAHKHTSSSSSPLTLTLIIIFMVSSHFSASSCTANKHDQLFALSHIQMKKLKNPQSIDRSSHHFNGSHPTFGHDGFIKTYPQGPKDDDLIKSWPGQPPAPPPAAKFKQYGGYVTVNPDAGRAFYYYFVEARNPTKNKHHDQLPLLLWLNGGPGCSSLTYGALSELGPFRVNSDGKTLYENKYSWNYAANVLFLESPAGVGFSYSNTTSDTANGGDKETAKDNYVFLLNWLEKFPEYKNREFYISGESYAGHYVPQLAHVILYNNLKTNKTIINLKGIIIGNAVINDETDEKGMYEYFGTHALASDEVTEQILKYCDFSPKAMNQSTKCDDALSEFYTQIGNIDIYNIYAPICHDSSVTNKPKRTTGNTIDPCSDYYVTAYLNRPDVQKAIHANVTNIQYSYSPCNNIKWEDSPSTVIPLLKELMANDIRVWIFSGDIDGRIPVTSTKKSIKKMNVPIKIAWRPWYIAGEVGGYTQEYEGGLTFATVRGAGHQVPSYQPQRALSLIVHFLAGTHLPN